MLDYEKLLEIGMKKVPKRAEAKSRFEPPSAQVLKMGNKTELTNFYDIANYLRREPDHMLKFLLKELATSCETKEQRIVCIGNFSSDLVNKKIELYIKFYVTCSECKKPDTRILKEGRFHFLKCEACGAKHPVSKV